MEVRGAFRGKGLITQFKSFKKSDEEILNAFSNFGTTLQIPENIVAQMKRYVCFLYGNNYDKTIKGIYQRTRF